MEPNKSKPSYNQTKPNIKPNNFNDVENNGGKNDTYKEPPGKELIIKPDITKSIVFNYSDIELTGAMHDLLNLGLNFSILPLKLDITQVLVDFKQFERSVIWQEFWFGTDRDKDYKAPIFKSQKRNLPKNYKVPNGVRTFLNSVKSELMDPRNRNSSECNLTTEKIAALKELITLQRERVITIKACDKGAGIIILNFKDYMRACYEHLYSSLENRGELPQNYYKMVDDIFLQRAKIEIISVLQEGFKNRQITDGEFQAMDPKDCDPGRFYCNFKVHKDHKLGETPAVRPIISGSGSITENIGKFVDHHIQKVAKKHKSFLEDTPDFLRNIEFQNQSEKLPPNSCLVTADIKGAYQNIPQGDGIDCLNDTLEEREIKETSSEFISKLMELVLKYNLFEFHGAPYQQLIGTAMGSKPAPSYANIYLAKRIDTEIEKSGFKYGQDGSTVFKMFKRFLDDIFLIYTGSTKKLHDLFNDLNQVHSSLKFTFQHTTPSYEAEKDRCSCVITDFIPFLDTSCSIENGEIDTDQQIEINISSQLVAILEKPPSLSHFHLGSGL